MTQIKFVFGTIILLGVVTMNSCDKSTAAPAPSLAETQFALLKNTWKVSSAKVDGTDVTVADYSKFLLTMGGSASAITYTTSGRPSLSPWAERGTMTFGADATKQLFRDPGASQQDIGYEASGTTLVLRFKFSGTGFNGRSESVGGNWEISFAKQ